MKILFDHQVFEMECYGGISRYFSELRKHLTNHNITVEISLMKGINKYYNTINPKKFYTYSSFVNGYEFLGKGKLYILFQWLNLVKDLYKENQKNSIKTIKSGDFDVFHPTYYDDYFLPYLNKPFIITVHDLIHEKFPEYFNNSSEIIRKKENLIKNSKSIIAISESTKKDLISYYNINKSKIKVIYHGASFSSTNSNFISSDKQFGKYIIYIGSRGKYKNFQMLPPVFKELSDANLVDNLVCLGGGKFTFEETLLFKKLNIEEKIKGLSVSDSEAKVLLRNAIALVITSKYEGFGLTILEAFANKCPVILGHNSSLPEVAGNHGIYFDSNNPQSLYFKIKELVCSLSSSSNSLKDVEIHLRKFNWNKTAYQTSEVYNEVFKGYY